MAVDPTNQSSFAFGEFRLDSVERVLTRAGEPVPLTPKLFDLLLILIENHGHVVAKERLMKEIWPDTFVEEGNLTQNISVLRKILSHNGQQYIQTVPRRGYRFVGQVRELRDETLLLAEHSSARVVEETHPENHFRRESVPVETPVAINGPGSTGRAWRRMVAISVVALTVIAFAGIGWTIFGPRKVASRNPVPFNVSNVTLRTITSSTGNIVYGVISAEGQFVVYGTVDGDNRYALWLQRTGSREVLQLVPPTAHPVGPAAISHDSNWIYYGESNPNDRLRGSRSTGCRCLAGRRARFWRVFTCLPRFRRMISAYCCIALKHQAALT